MLKKNEVSPPKKRTGKWNEFPRSEQTARASFDCSVDSRRRKMVCEVSFLLKLFCISLHFFWHLKTEYVFFYHHFLYFVLGGSVVNKAVITTNCSIKVGWRSFVQRPSLVYRPKSTRHGQWKAHSDCHAITEESFLILPLYSYVYSRLSPSRPPSPYISFLFGSLADQRAVSWSDCSDNRAKLAQRPRLNIHCLDSIDSSDWETLYLFLLLLLQQLPPSYLDSSQQRHQLPCVIYSVVVGVASNMP